MVKHPGVMSDEVYTKILTDIADYMPLFQDKFCPYLMNEPFADKKLLPRIEEAITTLYHPFLEVSTNLTLPTTDQLDELVRLYSLNGNHGRIMISHHGISKTKYESTMGLPFGKALKNLLYLITISKQNIPIWIHTALQSVDGTIQLHSRNEIITGWLHWFNEHGLPTHNITIFPLFFHNRAGNVKYNQWNPPSISFIGCPRKDDLHVLWNGTVVSCCCDYQVEQVLGDLTKQSVSEYFASSAYKKWTNILTGKEEPPEQFICKRCTHIGA